MAVSARCGFAFAFALSFVLSFVLSSLSSRVRCARLASTPTGSGGLFHNTSPGRPIHA